LSEVRVLAVFFGGVDHRQQILDRLRHRASGSSRQSRA
jgi:hypothetical protein